MRPVIKCIAPAFLLAFATVPAQANEAPPATESMPLGMVIAIQGDQALEAIRAGSTASIASAVERLSLDALQRGYSASMATGGGASPETTIVMAIDR